MLRFEPGMVLTVEPSYCHHDVEIPGFIKHMVSVTERVAEVLTVSLPRSAEDQERLVLRQPG